MAVFVLNSYSLISPTYSFTAPATSTKYEGETVTFSISTTKFGTGTLYWTVESVTGSVSNADFSSPSNAVTAGGSVAITNGTGSFTLTLASDASAETESFRVRLRINSTSGEIVATSNTITISDPPTGAGSYTTAGTYTFVVPTGVYSISAVLVGGGAAAIQPTTAQASSGGGGGGGLRYINSLPVTPGESITVTVGAGGNPGAVGVAGPGGTSSLARGAAILVQATGGQSAGVNVDGAGGSGTSLGAGPYGGTIGGGDGGVGGRRSNQYYSGGGGGAGGYSGNGGQGYWFINNSTSGDATNAASGSGGGGGGTAGAYDNAGGGGGVGLNGIGSDGVAGNPATPTAATGGSGGASGNVPNNAQPNSTSGNGGAYGGGGGGRPKYLNTFYSSSHMGAVGAVRIIYGTGRSFPSNAA